MSEKVVNMPAKALSPRVEWAVERLEKACRSEGQGTLYVHLHDNGYTHVTVFDGDDAQRRLTHRQGEWYETLILEDEEER